MVTQIRMTPTPKPKKSLSAHLFAGGVAGCCEAFACHPLDTIKVRLQLKGERKAISKLTNITPNPAQVIKVIDKHFITRMPLNKHL